MYQYSAKDIQELLAKILLVFPDHYAVFDCRRLCQQLFPVALLTLLDHSLDKLPENVKDPLYILQNIVLKEEDLLKEIEAIIKELEQLDSDSLNVDQPEDAMDLAEDSYLKSMKVDYYK